MVTEHTPPQAPPPLADTDWFLQMLVGMTNDAMFEVGITLQVSGMLVSGSLVSGKAYFDGFAADFASIFAEPEIASSIRRDLSSYGDVYNAPDEGQPDRPPPQYVHLKNARFFNTAGKPIPANRGVWWRGRIREVGGFTLGSLSAADPG